MRHRLLKLCLIGVLLTCASTNRLSAQIIFLSTETKGLFSVDMGNNFKVENISSVKNWDIGSIALYRDSLYFLDKTTHTLHSAVLDPVSPKKTDLLPYIPGGANTLTVDNNGVLWAFENRYKHLYRTSTVFFSGYTTNLPFTPSGDMVFHKGKLYLSADEGIVEVTKDFLLMGTSVIIPTNGRVFAGLVNVSENCAGNRVYGVETIGTTTQLVEIDIDNKKIGNIRASFSLEDDKVFDAASYNETGEQPFILARTISITPLCFPQTDTRIALHAYTAEGDSGISYTLTHGNEIKQALNRKGPITFNEPATPGTWNLQIKSSNGCRIDTAVEIYPPGKVVAAIASIQADTCARSTGGVIVQTTEGKAPLHFEISGLPVSASPKITGLQAGQYKLKVRDSTQCTTEELPFTIAAYSISDPVSDIAIVPGSVCAQNGEITAWYRASAAIDSLRIDNGNFGTKNHFTNLPPGAHRVQLKTGNCVYDTLVIVPVSTAVPVIDSFITHNICLGTGNIKVVVSGAEGPYRFEVAGGMYHSGIEVRNMSSGTHPVKIFNAAKCLVDSFAFSIPQKGDCDTLQAIYVPSAFTPNGDGKNDILKPLKNPLGKVSHFVFRIYNRLGQVVFESSSVGTGWDGNYRNIPQPMGTYVWMFEATQGDGRKMIFSGTTVLIR